MIQTIERCTEHVSTTTAIYTSRLMFVLDVQALAHFERSNSFGPQW